MMDISQTTSAIAAAFIKAQADLEPVTKNRKGYGYTYADLAAVDQSAREALSKHNLAITQTFEPSQGRDVLNVRTTLWHESGEYISGVLSIPVPDMKGSNAAQNAGSAITYARRYSLAAMVGIITEDDDAATCKEPPYTPQVARSQLNDAKTLDELQVAWSRAYKAGFTSLESLKDERKKALTDGIPA